MARADRYVSWSGPCPCGSGRVEEVVIDYDKMYASTDRELSVTCDVCRGDYSFRLGRDGEMRATPRSGGPSLTLVEAR